MALISRDALRKEILTAKLEAIRSGKWTDAVFLVGAADGTDKLWEVHAIKAVMIVSSEFMKGVFNSPMGLINPIRITSFNHNTFRLVVEFSHLNELLSHINLDEAIDLAIAADVLLMDSMKKYCKLIIEAKVTDLTVWTVLDKLLKFNLHDVAEACVPWLVTKTNRCISQHDAKNTSEESVIFLLKQRNLTIKSEKELVDFCANWAKRKEPHEREALRRLLPHLRLLSLTPLETTKLPPNFLTKNEKLAVLEANVTKPLTRATLNKIPKILCSETRMRCVAVQKQHLITVSMSTIKENMKRMASRELCSIRNTLRIVPKVNMNLVQVVFLGCYAKASQNLSEKMLIRATVTSTSKAHACNFEILLTKGKKGYLNLEKDPIFLPKNKMTEITLTISLIGTAYFLNHIKCPVIENTSHFKNLNLSKDSFVMFFESFGFVPA